MTAKCTYYNSLYNHYYHIIKHNHNHYRCCAINNNYRSQWRLHRSVVITPYSICCICMLRQMISNNMHIHISFSKSLCYANTIKPINTQNQPCFFAIAPLFLFAAAASGDPPLTSPTYLNPCVFTCVCMASISLSSDSRSFR